MTEPICKVADIIYVRFELKEFEEQKKYFGHFGLMLAHEDENSIFFRGCGSAPYAYVATKGTENKYIGTAYKANNFSDLEALSKEFNVEIEEIDVILEQNIYDLLILIVSSLLIIRGPDWYSPYSAVLEIE